MFAPKLRVVFLATPEFALPCLSMLHNHPKISLIHVVSMPDRPSGRGQSLKSPAVIEYAKTHNIPFTQTANINDEEALLNSLKENVDLVIVLAFAQFLKKQWLGLPKLGCYNIHTSLLPKYRGAAPIQYALLNGDKETGVSIQKMVSKMDAGNVVHEIKLPIRTFDNSASLATKLQFLSAIALEEFLEMILSNKLQEKVQDESGVSFAPEISKSMGHVDFGSENKLSILRKLQGLTPWPGIYFFLNSKRVKIHDIEIPEPENLFVTKPGEIKILHQQLIVGCLDGSLRISSLQLEGKEKTTDKQFCLGVREELHITKEPTRV